MEAKEQKHVPIANSGPVHIRHPKLSVHYNDVIMNAMASQITSLTIVYSTDCSGADQRKHQSSASLTFVTGIDRCMMTSSNGNIFRVTCPLCGEFTGPGEFLRQRPVTRSSDVFFELRVNKRLSKQMQGWWFETPASSLWRHCNGPMNSPHKGPAMRKMFPFDDVIMSLCLHST